MKIAQKNNQLLKKKITHKKNSENFEAISSISSRLFEKNNNQ